MRLKPTTCACLHSTWASMLPKIIYYYLKMASAGSFHSLEKEALKHNENASVHTKLYYWKTKHKIAKVKMIILHKNVPHQC